MSYLSSPRSRSRGSCPRKTTWRVMQSAGSVCWHHEVTTVVLTTDDQIEIDVRDDAVAMTRLFTLPASAPLDALTSMRGISAFDEQPLKLLKQIHEQGDGFRVN